MNTYTQMYIGLNCKHWGLTGDRHCLGGDSYFDNSSTEYPKTLTQFTTDQSSLWKQSRRKRLKATGSHGMPAGPFHESKQIHKGRLKRDVSTWKSHARGNGAEAMPSLNMGALLSSRRKRKKRDLLQWSGELAAGHSYKTKPGSMERPGLFSQSSNQMGIYQNRSQNHNVKSNFGPISGSIYRGEF